MFKIYQIFIEFLRLLLLLWLQWTGLSLRWFYRIKINYCHIIYNVVFLFRKYSYGQANNHNRNETAANWENRYIFTFIV